ncbi:hypothetical protein VNO80_26943 [Phaseolus coccineus]|uniref:Uncharacterized protein n=1 Tax=Phaseolus coccineus TaxID=3886 RepID=A0AAN9LIY7_PHACN
MSGRGGRVPFRHLPKHTPTVLSTLLALDPWLSSPYFASLAEFQCYPFPLFPIGCRKILQELCIKLEIHSHKSFRIWVLL